MSLYTVMDTCKYYFIKYKYLLVLLNYILILLKYYIGTYLINYNFLHTFTRFLYLSIISIITDIK